jgi:hypothetical protein
MEYFEPKTLGDVSLLAQRRLEKQMPQRQSLQLVYAMCSNRQGEVV